MTAAANRSFAAILCCLVAVFACGLSPRAFAAAPDALNSIIPCLAAPKVEDRAGAQRNLELLAARAARPGAEAERAALAEAMAAAVGDPSVPQLAQVSLVRQLELIGNAESVKSLTALLNGPDAELRECARRALERNPSSLAAKSLRAALERGGDASWQIGLMNSLGERGDSSSAGLIARRLSLPGLGTAAATALGKIANGAAVKELWTAFDLGHDAAGDALVTAAKRLDAKGETRDARKIYAKLYASNRRGAWRPAALAGLARTDPGHARSLIPEALASQDPRLQSVAVAIAPAACGSDASAQLAALLPSLPASAKTLVLAKMDASAEAQVMVLCADPDVQVRVAALRALGRMGSAASVPALVNASTNSASPEGKEAAAALGAISGPGISDAIQCQAGQGDLKARSAAIRALGQRHDRAAIPTLLSWASDARTDAVLRSAACDALGQVGSDSELEPMIELSINGAPHADQAARLVAGRVQAKAAAAKHLLGLAAHAEPKQLVSLFNIVGALGGPDALAALSGSASSTNDAVKDAAIRELAGWTDFAAAKSLQAIIVAPQTSPVHHVLAIEAIARLVTDCDAESKANRAEAGLAALAAATGPEEKKQILPALGSVPVTKEVPVIKPILTDPDLKTEAGLAAMTIAEGLAKNDKAAAKELAQAVKDAAPSPEIVQRAEAILNGK